MKNIITLLMLIIPLGGYSQTDYNYYVDNVEGVQYLRIKYCIDSTGRTNSVEADSTLSTYSNKENITKLVDNVKSVPQITDSNMFGNCYDYWFGLINKSIENKVLSPEECESCIKFRLGSFKYIDKRYSDFVVIRKRKLQIETDGNETLKYAIEWKSECEYSLTYKEVSNEAHEFLIGETIDVKIIGILSDQKYVYISKLMDGNTIIGLLEKSK